ncbi:mitochondrial fission protein ELM1-like protein [Syncephalis pseudoplumigaleata]|uniref:Mitochondrial fission protein ELM1-like protein n=1 Tax=Syncephalis pseudoplumigaleata TaxID=1712513 RepID=A0A4P9YT01_9FUNG|nr:mitochondrial fission protein ELM1-like protein [Syncephalis pseudoplumigaleata]|eukprot:RKP22828.1 mitochondrial fission protein ELM1-like protein [Syncephalis pseudoplumigaleata]
MARPSWAVQTTLHGHVTALPLSTSAHSPRIVEETWILGSGREEEERRAAAVAEALGLPCTIKRVYPRPSAFAGQHRWPWYSTTHSERASSSMATLPRYAIACGLNTIPACFELDAISRRRTMTVYIGYPKLPLGYFGAVVLIRHQLRRLGRMHMMVLSQKNLIIAETAPHRVHKLALSVAAHQSKDYLPSSLVAALAEQKAKQAATTSPRPLVAVIVGGVHAEFRWTAQDAQQYASKVAMLDKIMPNAQVLILTTRAAPSYVANLFNDIGAANVHHMHALENTNASHRQLMAVLAHATHICVSTSSTQLVEEAVAAG